MATGYVLYNQMAGNENSLEQIQTLELLYDEPLKFIDVQEVTNYRVFLQGLEADDYIILAGGDGTLNHFINNAEGIAYPNEVLYFPNGTGNDFAGDLGYERACNPFPIKKYLQDLPFVTVKGKKYRFLNGVGYGIDGYCCQVGDELKKNPGKKVNYTAIAIKGLLLHYKPTGAKVTVDGCTHTYKKVWIAPTMNGRRYGGGMMPTPLQQRNSGNLSTMIFHDSGKLKTLMIFPSIFQGKHVRHTEVVDIFTGREVNVQFDRPVALQIDGETILDVSEYTACIPEGSCYERQERVN